MINREGQIILFQTLDELRILGPIALREWLKRNRPPRVGGVGVVVPFRGHQEAMASEAGP